MDSISVAEAAARLSISSVAAYSALNSGRLAQVRRSSPARVTAESVQLLAHQRRLEALRRRGGDVTGLARHVDVTLHGVPGAAYYPQPYAAPPPCGREALRLLPAEAAAAVFGRDVLEAAADRDKIRAEGGCPVCWAHTAATVHQTRGPQDDPATRILLGEGCPVDRRRWAAEQAERRRQLDRLRVTEERKRQQAEQARLKAEYASARRAAESAAERLRTATTAYAVDGSIVREATAQARQRGAFRAAPRPDKWPLGCDCDAQHQCSRHAAMDAAARPSRPLRRS